MSPRTDESRLSIALISVHGLIRGENLELGRDPDTGGQTKYVVELARVLGRQPDVARVDLFTRRIDAPEVAADYNRPVEPIGPNTRIVRIDAGPRTEYLPKESLWDVLDEFVDNMAAFLREAERLPDILHSHYADAGYVGSRLGHMLGIPLVHTGHSLGRVKRRRLLATGVASTEINARYAMERRIDAEETTLAAAERVITSTHQEIEEQYELYDHYQPHAMRVIPPGTDLTLFHPPDGADEPNTRVAQAILRFLDEPDKPQILALSRADPRKNIGALIEAYGTSKRLQELANLVVVLGSRDDIDELDEGARDVFLELLVAIDRHDLYGKVACPKRHEADDVPSIYRLAAHTNGVFVNAALTEPFGLTLLEAAASGLPVVATEDGGPRDILSNCHHGALVDPLDVESIQRELLRILEDDAHRLALVEAGVAGVRKHYAWQAHATAYLDVVRPVVDRTGVLERIERTRRAALHKDRAIVTDLDDSLLGDPEALSVFIGMLREQRASTAFVIATGRRLDSALKALHAHGIPAPDILITSSGTEIASQPELTGDVHWARHIDHQWTPHVARRVLAELPGLTPQPASEQSRFKVSYYYDPDVAPPLEYIVSRLHQEELTMTTSLAFDQYLDILPARASKGLAVRYIAHQHDIPLEKFLVVGATGADEDMLRGNTLSAIVAGRHEHELAHIAGDRHVYIASTRSASGVLEALEHFDFFGACRVPADEPEPTA